MAPKSSEMQQLPCPGGCAEAMSKKFAQLTSRTRTGATVAAPGATGCKFVGAMLWLTWMGLSLAYIFQAPGPVMEVQQRILSSTNTTFGATTDSLSKKELESRRMFFLSSSVASIFVLYLIASLVVWSRTGSFQFNLNAFIPCRKCFDCNCLLELFLVPTEGTSKLSCYCGLCAPVTHCWGERSTEYELSLRAGQPVEMVAVEDAKIFTKAPHPLQTGDVVVYVPSSCSKCAAGPALTDAETGPLLSNDLETSDPIFYFVRKVTDDSFALCRVKDGMEIPLRGGGPGHYFIKVLQQDDDEPLEERVSKQLTQMNFQFVRNRRRLTWVCLACYVVAATLVPTLHRSQVSCENGFYWETHLQFFGVFMAVKLAEVFIYHVDPTITRHPRAWTFLEKFLFSIPGFFDGYTDLTAVFVGYACKDEKDDPMMATRITDMMLTSYILGVVILQWFILPAIAAEDPSNVLLCKIVHMDSLASCSQFPEDFRQRWNILAAARTFAEDIPQAIFQALLIIYVQWNPALFISVGFSVGTTLKAFMDAINHHLQPSQLVQTIQEQVLLIPQERIQEVSVPLIVEHVVEVPVPVVKEVPVYVTQHDSYPPLGGPIVIPGPAAMASASAGPEHPVAAMSAGMYGPPPPTVGATGAADGTANKNAPPEVKAPPVAEGMNAPDSLEAVSAMDPLLGIGFSVEDRDQHFEPDHLLQAMECKTLRPKGQPGPAAMASASAGPEHPVAAMSAGMYGPPPPTVGATGAADGTANKNAPPEVKAPPVAEGMNAPDSLEAVSAMDPRLGIGFSVEDRDQHFEPDHLLQAMECKTLRPKGQPVSFLSARPPAKDEHYAAVLLQDEDSDQLPPQLSWRKAAFEQLATQKTLWTADDAVSPQTKTVLKGQKFAEDMASIFHAFDGKAGSGVRKGRLNFTEVQQALFCGSWDNKTLFVFRWVLGVQSEAEGQQRLSQILDETANRDLSSEQLLDPHRQFVSKALSDLQVFIQTVFKVNTISLSIGQWVKLCTHLVVMASNLKTKMLFHSQEVCKNISGEPNRSICPLLCLGVGVTEVYRANFPLHKVKTIEVPQIQFMDKVVEVPVIQKVEKHVEVPQVQFVQKVVEAPHLVDLQTAELQRLPTGGLKSSF